MNPDGQFSVFCLGLFPHLGKSPLAVTSYRRIAPHLINEKNPAAPAGAQLQRLVGKMIIFAQPLANDQFAEGARPGQLRGR